MKKSILEVNLKEKNFLILKQNILDELFGYIDPKNEIMELNTFFFVF